MVGNRTSHHCLSGTLELIFVEQIVPRATNTQSEYVILIAFPLPPWLYERALMLRSTHFACLEYF